MTRDDIIRLSGEAGFLLGCYGQAFTNESLDAVVGRFAALVAAHEREECAKVCDRRYMGDNNREDMEARRCAAAIRARGEK